MVEVEQPKARRAKTLTDSPIRNYIVGMKAQIVKIGNSQGIWIPKPFLQQSGISDEVDIEVNGSEIIRSLRSPREGWEDSFRRMAAKGDDRLLDEESLPTQSSWDEEECEL